MRLAVIALVVGCGSSGSGSIDATPGDMSTGDSTAGGGTCLSPQPIVIGFQEAATASTAAKLDVTMLTCAPAPNLQEAVYQLVLAQPTTVHITASDRSGQGVGVQVRADSCTGTSVLCRWENSGDIDQMLALPAGTWVFVVERTPAGAFAFGVAL